MKGAKGNLGAARFLYLVASTVFLSFLIYSAPHLVHHPFDDAQSSPCLAFSVAKGCHLQPISEINLPTIQLAGEEITLPLEVWIPYLNPSPFSKRAPPVAKS